MSKQCPIGCNKAEELYQLGRKYREGHDGFPTSSEKAEKMFEEALAMGNAKAALQIGQLYMYEFSSSRKKGSVATCRKYMIAMYQQAMKMGCPEAYMVMAECYDKGWGVKEDTKKAIDLLQKAAEMGSPKAMEFYGNYLIWSQAQLEVGRQWLHHSMDLGNGDAGGALADTYRFLEGSIDGIVLSLRAGAALGSSECLLRLKMLYDNGYYGQNEDEGYAQCFAKLLELIDEFDPPKPIPNFDKLCPLKQPYQPFRRY